MKRKPLQLTALIFAIGALLVYGCDKEDEPQNSPPRIRSITTTPNTSSSNRLPGGDQVTISVSATDADKDNLSYSWEADGGNFVGSSNEPSVNWESPISTNEEQYRITVTVSDGADTDSEYTFIYVEKVTPGINATPKTFDFGTNETEYQVKIFNTGEGILKWETYSEGASWLSVNPNSGTINIPNDTAYVSLIINRDGLSPGNYSEGFRFRNDENTSNYVSIIVEMEVPTPPETADIEGFVYYASTTIPVSGVLVAVGEKTSTTGTDGSYEINDVITGTQTLTATKDGYDTYSTNIQIGSTNNEHNIEMTSAEYTHNLSGTITDGLSGSAISYVDVVVLNPDDTESDLKTTSSSNGYYQIPTVPQGTRTIRFTHDEYQEAEIDIFMANSNYELNFEMNTCLPIVATGNYELLYPQTVEISGNISSLGCSNITEHGFCWSEYPYPTINNELIDLGNTNSSGSYSSQVVILKENTQYHIRAFATNSFGTNYGDDIILTTGSFPDCGSIYYGGINYETVQIGDQCWMKENLNYPTSGSWCYDNNSNNCDTYGRLYNWYAMMNGASSSNEVPSGVQGICPEGWHVPSDAEWDILVDFLGGSNIAGGKMKQPGTSLWDSPNTGATNLSGFSALPGGSRNGNGSFWQQGEYGLFWSSFGEPEPFDSAWFRYLQDNDSGVFRSNNLYYLDKYSGMSVRCVKD